eukprot:jgi/Mesen1/3846/ME000207S02855
MDTIEGRIMAFVNEQNRPLNAQYVADMLQTFGVKKTAAQKVLDAAASKGEIHFKDFGKQRIYMAKQDRFERADLAGLEGLKKENEKLQLEVQEANRSCVEDEAALRSMQSLLTGEQIDSTIERLTEENDNMEKKLGQLREGGIVISADDRKKAEDLYETSTALWKKRKRMFKDLWDTVTESMPKDLKEFRVSNFAIKCHPHPPSDLVTRD